MATGEDAVPPASSALRGAFESLADRRLLLFGGKGGVGKTTMAVAAALHFSESRDVVLFATDPASNLDDLLGRDAPPRLRVESLDADALYARFLEMNLAHFLEIGDRGTYLDRDELRRFFELSLPGIDELMAWMRIGELAEESRDSIVIVDTAPTGHTLRMLSAGSQFARLANALDALEEKHRAMVRQFTRRTVRDAVDAFIEEFTRQAADRAALVSDRGSTAFVPVTLAEPWVVEQTARLVEELRSAGVAAPLTILNRAVGEPDCARDRERRAADDQVRERFANVVAAERACEPLDSVVAIRRYLRGQRGGRPVEGVTAPPESMPLALPRIVFFAGKGGVGKTTSAASVALQLALHDPARRYVVISVDPAHAIRDVFTREAPPPNLDVETVETKAQWDRLRSRIGAEIERAVDALTPGAMTVSYDADAMRQLLDIGPPGADEIFAVMRLAKLFSDDSLAGVIVDTAPTGHFLRLLDLPRTAGEWVRELMRLLLRYRELVPAGALGEELIEASRALRQLEATLRSAEAGVVVVTRPERIVVAETMRLGAALRERGIHVVGTIANYVTGESACSCDRSVRAHELALLQQFEQPLQVIERRDFPVTDLRDLAALVRVG